MSTQRILVTGSAGRLGRATIRELTRQGLDVTGFDLVPTPGLTPERFIVGTLADRRAVEKAVEGKTCIIHLGATPDDAKDAAGNITFDPDHFPDSLLPNNILGSYHVMDAARKHGVGRVILASTGQTIDGHLESGRIPVRTDVEYQPLYLYACTKVFLEQLGRVFARHHGIHVLAVRLGWCPRDAGQVAQIAADPECQDVYLSPGDAGRFFAAAVHAHSLPPYSVCFATSRHTHRLTYDLEPAKTLLDWEPTESWPTGATEF